MSAKFPEEFLFGVSTSAYQIEGAYNEDGKGENIWDYMTHKKCIPNGDIACDSYHNYKKDVKLLKDAGFDLYRFSISWTRIFPNGEITSINQKGVEYYNKLIDKLRENNIEPVVTMYHWDLPQKLQNIDNGWMNPQIVDYFEAYADQLFQLFGDKVKWWITINEPEQIFSGYENGEYAPALNLGTSALYKVAHNLLRAHARVFRLYDRKYRSVQNGRIGISLSIIYYQSKTDMDIEAANRAMQFYLGLFAHPIFTKEGDYPKIVREIVDELSEKEGLPESRLPYFTADEIESLKGAYDFFGVNHYTTRLCSDGIADPSKNIRPFDKDINVTFSIDDSWPGSHANWLKVVPWGFKKLLKFIKDNYDNPPVLVTENGYCDSEQTGTADEERVSYHTKYLTSLLEAVNEDKCNVIGYIVWSLLDDFEWQYGYDYKFGIVRVDFEDENRERIPKDSYCFFKKLLKTRTLP